MSGSDLSGSRRVFLIGATSVVGAAGMAGAALPFVGYWNPSARAKAAGAPIKVDISRVAPGELLGPIPAWRNQPVFVVRRTEQQLAALERPPGQLADPDSAADQQPDYARNPHRSIRPDILIIVGLCTHLGCSPKFHPEVRATSFDADWQGGFFCPCHGSRFDLAGRVYAGVPAPTNLLVPPHYYETEDVVVIGEEGAA